MNLLIRNAHIINPDRSFDADIAIGNGKIFSVESSGSISFSNDVEVIDAKGMLVLPGGIAPHVHLSLQTPAGP